MMRTDIVRSLLEATDRFDVPAMMRHFAPDAVMRFGSAPPVGMDEFRAMNERLPEAYAAIAHDVTGLWEIAADDAVVAEMTVRYTRHDGEQVGIPGVSIFIFKGEEVSLYRIYMDPGPVLGRA